MKNRKIESDIWSYVDNKIWRGYMQVIWTDSGQTIFDKAYGGVTNIIGTWSSEFQGEIEYEDEKP